MMKGTMMAMVAAATMTMASGAMAKGLNLKPREITGVVNINTATAKELELLPGVGAKTARVIIAHREKQSFKTAADILKVKGIGPATFAKIKDHLTVAGPTTLALKHGGGASAKAKAKADQPPAQAAAQ